MSITLNLVHSEIRIKCQQYEYFDYIIKPEEKASVILFESTIITGEEACPKAELHGLVAMNAIEVFEDLYDVDMEFTKDIRVTIDDLAEIGMKEYLPFPF